MRYPGGKGRCYQHLISLMPPHRTYIESHLGGGAVMRHKRPAESTIGIEIDARVVARWANIPLEGIEIVHGDGVEFLQNYAFKGDELVYCDPPYPKETRSGGQIYRYEYELDDHVRLIKCVLKLPCMVIISSYINELYLDMLSSWRVVHFPGDSHTGARVETAWLNFPEPDTLHDYRYCGGDFRSREQIRRRRDSLLKRISSLSYLERSALFGGLAREYQDELRIAADL